MNWRGPHSRLRHLWIAAALSAVMLSGTVQGGAAAGTGSFGTFAPAAIDDLVVAPDGSIMGSDLGNGRIYRVSPSGAVSVFAGAGPGGFDNGYSGDGGPAIDAHFGGIVGLAWAHDGSLLAVDHLNDVVRRIDANGIVTTVVGSGPFYSWYHGPWYPQLKGVGDGGPALAATLDAPWDIEVDLLGNLYIADRDHDALRRVDPSGIITTVAGTGQGAFGGDGGSATEAKLNRPLDTAFSTLGGFYIADENNARVRYVDAGGRISTFAGNGKLGCLGDGGPAASASLQNVGSLTVTPNGSVVVSQGECHRVRVVGPDGIIRPLLGNGIDACGEAEGALATSISISTPAGLALDFAGSTIGN